MSGHFEAKKHAYRQTQDGIVVSFVIHPNDVDAVFAIAPLGTRYMLGFAEIGDDGKPVVEPAPQAAGGHARAVALTPEVRSEIAAKAANTRWDASKERKPFASLPLSQQAAIRCGDVLFQEFMKAVSNADCAALVRAHCHIQSRAELDHPNQAYLPAQLWRVLEAQYQSWLTDRKFAEARR